VINRDAFTALFPQDSSVTENHLQRRFFELALAAKSVIFAEAQAFTY
jgi:hypothetical protein